MSLWSWRWCCWWAPWCCAPAQLPRGFSPWRLRWRCCRWRRSRHGPTRGWPSSLRGSLCAARHRIISTGSGNASAWWWFLGSCSAAWMMSSFCWGLTRHYVFFHREALCAKTMLLNPSFGCFLVSLSLVYSKHCFGPLWPAWSIEATRGTTCVACPWPMRPRPSWGKRGWTCAGWGRSWAADRSRSASARLAPADELLGRVQNKEAIVP